jgi:hypothetical protein
LALPVCWLAKLLDLLTDQEQKILANPMLPNNLINSLYDVPADTTDLDSREIRQKHRSFLDSILHSTFCKCELHLLVCAKQISKFSNHLEIILITLKATNSLLAPLRVELIFSSI